MLYTVSLKRDTKTGNYYTKDEKYKLEKGRFGWYVYKKIGRYSYDFAFTARSLKEAKENIAIRVLSGGY